MKQAIKNINEGTEKVEHFQLLASCLKISKAADLKIDLIQNTIEVIKYEIARATDVSKVYRLSKAYCEVLRSFFSKKETDMRKKGLKNIFQQQIWNENRIKLCNLQNETKAKAFSKVKISQQIMVTPYMAPQ